MGSATKAPLRKRRRINVDKAHKNDSNSYVLKLYDRSVNLAKFSPNTPLYPVCRAWIKNQPNTIPALIPIKYDLNLPIILNFSLLFILKLELTMDLGLFMQELMIKKSLGL